MISGNTKVRLLSQGSPAELLKYIKGHNDDDDKNT